MRHAVIVLAPLLVAHATGAADVLTPAMCASHDTAAVFGPAAAVHNSAANQLLAPSASGGGGFARVVEGRAVLHTGVGVGNFSGGGTNTNGAYFTFEWDSSVLPDGVCDSIPTSSGSDACPSSKDPFFPSGFKTLELMLGPSDAVVFYGCTPPPVEYFGYDYVVTTRLTEQYPFYPGTNFQDVLSWRSINTSSAGGAAGGAASGDGRAFDAPVMFVATADGASAAAVATAYAGAGVACPGACSTHSMDASTLRLIDRAQGWQTSKPDLIGHIHRVTMAAPGNSLQPKLGNTTTPPTI